MSCLSYKDRKFYLDGKPFRIWSGALHYFRVVPEYWRDRLLKLKACGLNTVETYVSWNLHEPQPGLFSNEGILDLRRFIQIAAELGLYVIFRPGPYICSEWDFGGLPSWLLADPNMKVRSNYPKYQEAVQRFFAWLLPQVVDLQKSKGGPIIAVQIENEYGSFSSETSHLQFIKSQLLQNGIKELLFTSDNETGARTSPYLPEVLPTANFQTVEEAKVVFDSILKAGPDYPLLVMEFWTGWFDHWGGKHELIPSSKLEESLNYSLDKGASFNLYMFHGGTNFGFMAGALNIDGYAPDVTSYDYDAPLTEDGQTTSKYNTLKSIVERERRKIGEDLSPETALPEAIPKISEDIKLEVNEFIKWSEILKCVDKTSSSSSPQWMETYSYQDKKIQSYGYIIYQKLLDKSFTKGQLAIEGVVRDRANILINGSCQGVVDWKVSNSNLSIVKREESANTVLDILVENLGRVNYTTSDKQNILNDQRKGINSTVSLQGQVLQDWQVFAFDFSTTFLENLKSAPWRSYEKGQKSNGPGLYRLKLELPSNPRDCFVHLPNWNKGVVIVNGFNLGRYWSIGPPKSLYLPAPLLKQGYNEVLVFEEVNNSDSLLLKNTPTLY